MCRRLCNLTAEMCWAGWAHRAGNDVGRLHFPGHLKKQLLRSSAIAHHMETTNAATGLENALSK